jgi:hypothetical protein
MATKTDNRKIYKTDLGILDMYKAYKLNQEANNKPVVSLSRYRAILKYFNVEVCKNIVSASNELRLPFRLGGLRIRKHKTRLKIDPNGKLITRHLHPNWKATNDLWKRNPEAKENNKIIYHTNDHTNGYYYKWYWDKRTCNIKNSSVYSLVMTRSNKRYISKIVKENIKIDYYE